MTNETITWRDLSNRLTPAQREQSEQFEANNPDPGEQK